MRKIDPNLLPIATTALNGGARPDGVTITVDVTGKLVGAASAGGGGAAVMAQTVTVGSRDASQVPNALQVNVNNTSVDLKAATTPFAGSIAMGYTGTTKALVERLFGITADVPSAWSGFAANTTNYLYLAVGVAGAVTYGSTLNAPVYSNTQPVQGVGPSTPASVYGSVIPLASDYTGDFTATFSTHFDTGNVPGDQGDLKIDLQTVAGVSLASFHIYDLNASTYTNTQDFALNGPIVNTTSVQYWINSPTSNLANVVFQRVGATWTLSVGGTVRYTGTGPTTTLHQLVFTRPVFTGSQGTTCDVQSTNIVPAVAGTIVDHYFDTGNYVMNNIVSNVNTVVPRVFVGEAVMGATTLSSVKTYAYNGYYDSGWFAVSNGYIIKNHNMGLFTSQGLHHEFYFSPTGVDSDSVPAHGLYQNGTTVVGAAQNSPGTTRTAIGFFFQGNVDSYFNNSAVVTATSGFYKMLTKRIW